MTIRDLGFWLYMLFLSALSLGIIWFSLVTQYHLGIEWRNEFIVLDVGDSSISVQWHGGDIRLWISSGHSSGGYGRHSENGSRLRTPPTA